MNTMVPMVIEILQLRDKSCRNDSYVTCKCCVTREKILELSIIYFKRKLKETSNEDQLFYLPKTNDVHSPILYKLFFKDKGGRRLGRQAGRQGGMAGREEREKGEGV